MATKYQVERRPISPNGQILRGSDLSNRVFSIVEPSLFKATNARMVDAQIFDIGFESSKVVDGDDTFRVQALNGEPWLVHSTHFSIESALESAAPLTGAVGQENVRIVKVLSHTTQFKLQ